MTRSGFEGHLDEPALEAWGRDIGAGYTPGLVIALSGPLGAGKSTLARAIGRGAGITRAMPSPTFNLVLGYRLPAGGRLLHFDLYRLARPEAEVADLGWEELGAADTLAVIEWADRASGILPGDRWDVALAFPPEGRARRSVRAESVGRPGPLPLPEPDSVRT